MKVFSWIWQKVLKNFRFFILISFIFSDSAPLFSQESEYRFERILPSNTYLNPTIRCFYEDRYGFIWIGTDYGLYKFDGNNISVYHKVINDTTSRLLNSVFLVYEDVYGDLCVVGQDDYKFCKYDRLYDSFTQHLANTASNKYPLPIPNSRKHSKFLCTSEDIFIYNPKINEYLRIEIKDKPKKLEIASFVEDQNGTLWIGSFIKGLMKFDPKNNTLKPYLPNSNIIDDRINSRIVSLFLDSRNHLWIVGMRAEVGLFDPLREIYLKKWNTQNNPQKINLTILSICEDDKGQIWMASENGVNIYNNNDGNFTVLKNNIYDRNSLISNTIRAVYKDNSGKIWVGTLDGGVNIYDPYLIKFKNVLPAINNNINQQNRSFKTAYRDKTGTLWVGTDYGLNKLNKDGKLIKTYIHDQNNSKSIGVGGVCAIHEDSVGNLWVGTWGGGLSKFNMANEVFTKFGHKKTYNENTDTIDNASILCLKTDSNGLLWIGTVSGIVDIFNPSNSTFKHLFLKTEYIRSLLIDEESNTVWCCSSMGLFKIDKKNFKVTQYLNIESDTNSISDNYTYNIVKEKSGIFWITTHSGLNKFDARTGLFKRYKGLNNTKLEFPKALQIDNQGFLWFSTKECLIKFDPASETYWYYNEFDGIVSTLTYSSKLSSGELVFGGFNGANIFNPQNINSNKQVSDVIITDFKIFNNSVKWQENKILSKAINYTNEINLSYKINVFGFDFTTLCYSAQNKIQYSYKLEGYDNTWKYTGDKRSINFSNVPPGNYIFRVKASNNEGFYGKNETTIKVNIIPPFWKTIWFKIILALATLLSIFLWLRMQTYNLKRRNEHLERLVKIRTTHLKEANIEMEAQKDEIERMANMAHESDQKRIRFLINLSHDFRTPLTLIINPIEKILTKISSNPEVVALFQVISKNAQSLLNLINQALDMRKIETQNMRLEVSQHELYTFLRNICNSFSYISESKLVKFNFEHNFSNAQAWFDEAKIERVLINLLSNAFKFTPQNGEITLNAQLSESKDCIKIEVKDNGIGIPSDKLEIIFDRFYQVRNEMSNAAYGTGIGLNLAKELIELHHGSIYVTSIVGHGSSFWIEFPIQKHCFEEHELLLMEPLKKTQVELLSNELNTAPEIEKAPKDAPYILIVEDNDDLRVFVKQNLSPFYHILEAENGVAGYEKVCEYMPDLIISDILMPKMNGFELCEKVKTDPNVCYIPVILLTSQMDVENQLQGLIFNADDYITKPFNIQVLKGRIDSILGNRKLLRKRFAQDFKIGPSAIAITSLDQIFIQKAIETIEQNISDAEFDVERFSQVMNLSSRQLQNKLKALTDLSPGDFIRYIRLKRAAQLIEKSGLNISEIAFDTGFTNPKYFSTAFKKHFGLTPSEFKEANQSS